MSIVDEIMKQVGVSKEQAEGGLGLIFKLAKDKLGADFSQVSSVVPEANGLIGKAPAEEQEAGGGLMGMLGGMAKVVCPAVCHEPVAEGANSSCEKEFW